jgi:predicted AlkP superfamily pyrophosphatase or phosphodiesterase
MRRFKISCDKATAPSKNLIKRKRVHMTLHWAGKRAALFALTLVCIFASTPNSQAAPREAERRADHVFIISFDQGGGKDLQKATNMPTFQKLAREGVRDWRAYTIVPSVTLPSHVSMLTGVGIQQHQIDWNDYRPDAGVVKVPTIFTLAKKRGLKTALYAGKEKFKHLNQPGSLDTFVIPGNASQVAATFAKDFPKTQPNLCFLHFADIDNEGHAHGLYSPEWLQALADSDAALKSVFNTIEKAGLLQKSVIILTADHGGHNVTNAEGATKGTHGSSKPEDVEIPWVVWGKGVRKNFNITASVVTYDTSATALWLLGVEIPETFWGRPVTSAFVK